MTKDANFKKLVRERMAATGQSYTAARAAMSWPEAAADLPMTRRVFGLKTSYTAAFEGARAPGESGAGEYLFRLAEAATIVSCTLRNIACWGGLRCLSLAASAVTWCWPSAA